MKLTAKVKLQPTPEQHRLLLETLMTANAACNHISQCAWQSQSFKQFALHHLVYYDLRSGDNPLSAQMVVRAIAKVADAYQRDKNTKRIFKPLGGFAYDSRLLSWPVERQTVSIWTVGGRQRISFVAGQRQLELLAGQRGESDLCLIKGQFYLFATCEVAEPAPVAVAGVVGVDLGIVNIATDSEGNRYSASQVLSLRQRRRRQRRRLQAKGTKAAKRRLKALSGKESRFATDVNHTISQQIVNLAQGTGRGIALENLQGIRNRVTVRRQQRDSLHSWSFHQLRHFITYKAKRAGIPLILVDPRNTSRTCSLCGHVDKANRPTQAAFLCRACGYAAHADDNAAKNIAVLGWGDVNHPYVGEPLLAV